MLVGRTDGFHIMVILYLRGQISDNYATKLDIQGTDK